jgi:hypothetical protein
VSHSFFQVGMALLSEVLLHCRGIHHQSSSSEAPLSLGQLVPIHDAWIRASVPTSTAEDTIFPEEHNDDHPQPWLSILSVLPVAEDAELCRVILLGIDSESFQACEATPAAQLLAIQYVLFHACGRVSLSSNERWWWMLSRFVVPLLLGLVNNDKRSEEDEDPFPIAVSDGGTASDFVEAVIRAALLYRSQTASPSAPSIHHCLTDGSQRAPRVFQRQCQILSMLYAASPADEVLRHAMIQQVSLTLNQLLGDGHLPDSVSIKVTRLSSWLQPLVQDLIPQLLEVADPVHRQRTVNDLWLCVWSLYESTRTQIDASPTGEMKHDHNISSKTLLVLTTVLCLIWPSTVTMAGMPCDSEFAQTDNDAASEQAPAVRQGRVWHIIYQCLSRFCHRDISAQLFDNDNNIAYRATLNTANNGRRNAVSSHHETMSISATGQILCRRGLYLLRMMVDSATAHHFVSCAETL